MNNKYLIDTNVLIYALDNNSIFHESVNNLIYQPNIELFTTSKNLVEFISVVTKGESPAFTMQQALNHVKTFESLITILFPSKQTYSIFIDLLDEYKPNGLKVHDFEIAAIGIANGITTLVTANTKDFSAIKQISLIKISPDKIS